MGTITSSNSHVYISIPALGLIQVPIQGYAADDAFAHESFELTETRQGVDGVLSAGYTPNPKKITFTLQADSPSIALFDAWGSGMEAAREAFPASMNIDMPSIGKSFALNVGWLRNFRKLPDAKKVLEPQQYTIEWQDIQPTTL